MQLSSINSYSPIKNVSTVKQNKNQYAASKALANDTVSFSGKGKIASAIIGLTALATVITGCGIKNANNAQDTTIPDNNTVVEETVPAIPVVCVDTVEDMKGYDSYVDTVADKLIKYAETTEEKVKILNNKAQELNTKAEILEAQNEEDFEQLEKDWEAFHITGEGSISDLDKENERIAFVRKDVEQKRNYAKGLNRIADEIANGTYESTATTTIPDIPWVCVDIAEDIEGYDKYIRAKAEELTLDGNSEDEKVEILQAEAEKYMTEAIEIELVIESAQEKLEEDWTALWLYHSNPSTQKEEELNEEAKRIAFLRKDAERNRKYADGLNKIADEIENKNFIPIVGEK